LPGVSILIRALILNYPWRLPASRPKIKTMPFHLAELASSFNCSTKVSPFYGTFLAAALVIGGFLPESSFIRDILITRITFTTRPLRPSSKCSLIPRRPER
jgi:hypothetical protein